MRRFLPVIFLAALSCARQPSGAPFSGEWRHSDENGITGVVIHERITVQADHKKFRVITVGPDAQQTIVYDGETKSSQFVGLPAPDEQGIALPEAAAVQHEKIADSAAEAFRFWSREVVGGAKPGDQVCGRATLLHELRSKRPDGEMSNQVWTDQETGYTLKTVNVIYSSQIRSVVVRETYECVSIQYGAVDASVFLSL